MLAVLDSQVTIELITKKVGIRFQNWEFRIRLSNIVICRNVMNIQQLSKVTTLYKDYKNKHKFIY